MPQTRSVPSGLGLMYRRRGITRGPWLLDDLRIGARVVYQPRSSASIWKTI